MTTLSTFFDMVYVQVSGSPGTGNATLGSALIGFQTPAAAGITNGTPVSYRMTDGTNWETAHGTIGVSGSTYTLTRGVDTIKSSNSNAGVNFGSGVTVVITELSQDLNTLVSVEGSQSFTTAQQTQGRSNLGLSIPGSVVFDAYLSANQTGLPSSPPTKLLYDATTLNQGGYWDGTNYRWVPPAGAVILRANIYLGPTTVWTVGLNNNIYIYKNGSPTAFSGFVAVTTTQAGLAEITFTDAANGTDYYEVFTGGQACFAYGFGSPNIFAACHFQGFCKKYDSNGE
jgi:hypothetical protein